MSTVNWLQWFCVRKWVACIWAAGWKRLLSSFTCIHLAFFVLTNFCYHFLHGLIYLLLISIINNILIAQGVAEVSKCLLPALGCPASALRRIQQGLPMTENKPITRSGQPRAGRGAELLSLRLPQKGPKASPAGAARWSARHLRQANFTLVALHRLRLQSAQFVQSSRPKAMEQRVGPSTHALVTHPPGAGPQAAADQRRDRPWWFKANSPRDLAAARGLAPQRVKATRGVWKAQLFAPLL